MDINSIISAIISPELQETMLPFRVVCFIAFSFFMCFIIWALFKTAWFKYHFLYDLVEFLTMRPYGVKKMTKIWNEAVEKVASNNQNEYKPALVEIDEILDIILIRFRHKGKNLTERLNQFTKKGFPPLLRVLEAHRTCEEIIADPNYKVDLEEAEKMLAAYKEAFECLHAFN